jgi:hypothetical protein
MAEKINFNIIIIITLLLVIIILLSGIKICKVPYNMATSHGRYIDTRYKYVSEPFTSPTLDPTIAKVGDLSKSLLERSLSQSVDQEKQNKKIGELVTQVSFLENKIKYLDKMI